MKAFAFLMATFLVGLSTGLEWWEHGNFYQIYPRSFKDSDGDGIGDLDGITQNLKYLKELGMDGVWLSPIFASPMDDFGYDISNFSAIQPEYGDMSAFERLSAKCKELGLRLILDFVPNHTSDKHKWFNRSVHSEEGYKDYYIWHPGVTLENGTKVPPSNWISVFRGSSWEWNDIRKEYFLHQFLKQQPDLNYRNPAVVEEMKNVLRFWLNKGVSGFRIDAVPYLVESAEFEGRYRDEPLSRATDDPENPAYLTHTQTMDQPETYDLVYGWRAVLDEYTKQDGQTRLMMTEGYTSLPKVVEFFGNSTVNGSQIPFNFQLISNINKNSTAADFAHYVKLWLDAKPTNRRSNWVLGNHDNNRLGTRLGEKKIDLYNIALQTLPDIAITYYGEEIGMVDQYIPFNETVDPAGLRAGEKDFALYSRDPARTPMQWDNGKNAGFSKGNKTWLPVASNYKKLNVKAQENARKSHLKTFKKLTKYRKRRILTEGDFDMQLINDNLLAYKRQSQKSGYVIVVLNFATVPQEINLPSKFANINRKMQVVASSAQVTTRDSGWIDTTNYKLAGEAGIVLQYLRGPNPIVS
ncbi:probable maltase [Toxorhynchites rutilus septentrionalis]|uniref:probable maltase n=1 Tax=Toxorhynchites rutilus septentrionalis TaxID=329112 RepID=UPI00247A2AFA|nr:probable maltase [Toxorhynchites rutilus septentrionalis]